MILTNNKKDGELFYFENLQEHIHTLGNFEQAHAFLSDLEKDQFLQLDFENDLQEISVKNKSSSSIIIILNSKILPENRKTPVKDGDILYINHKYEFKIHLDDQDYLIRPHDKNTNNTYSNHLNEPIPSYDPDDILLVLALESTRLAHLSPSPVDNTTSYSSKQHNRDHHNEGYSGTIESPSQEHIVTHTRKNHNSIDSYINSLEGTNHCIEEWVVESRPDILEHFPLHWENTLDQEYKNQQSQATVHASIKLGTYFPVTSQTTSFRES